MNALNEETRLCARKAEALLDVRRLIAQRQREDRRSVRAGVGKDTTARAVCRKGTAAAGRVDRHRGKNGCRVEDHGARNFLELLIGRLAVWNQTEVQCSVVSLRCGKIEGGCIRHASEHADGDDLKVRFEGTYE